MAQDLAQKLRGYPLGRYAFQLEESGKRWNVNPYMIAGIANLESTYGLAGCGPDFWGYNSCSSRPWSTVSEGIEYVSKRIRRVYMNEWGRRTVYSIGDKWCTCGNSYGYYLESELRHLGSPITAIYP